jgi:hypothetical protein
MTITTERAFWILNTYLRQSTPIDFGIMILSEPQTCLVTVTQVSLADQSISTRLVADNIDANRDRRISLCPGVFSFFQLGEPSFEAYEKLCWHSVLRADFPDGANVIFAEAFNQIGCSIIPLR